MTKVPRGRDCAPHQGRRPYRRSLRGQLARAFVLVTFATLFLAVGSIRWGGLNPWHVLFIALPLAAVVGVVTANLITGRLSRLSDAVERLDLKDLSQRVPVEGEDEVAVLARSLNRMAERLEAEERVRREFFADAAHELRHPIAVLQARLEAIQDGVSPLDMEQVMGLQDLTLVLARLVGDLRDLSLADVGRLTLNEETVDVGELVQDLAETMEPVAQSRGIALMPPAPQAELVLRADRGRLRQVFVNLLANALHYTPAGGRVEIRAWREGDRTMVQVRDTGQGIAPEDLTHIFDRFYRTDRSRSRETGGSGLGLAIARSIVEMHGGTITATSQLGEGSVFTVTLHTTR